MRTLMRFGRSIVLVTTLGVLTACPYSAMVVRDVTMKGDAWSMTVEYLRDGPDAFTTGGGQSTYHTPEDGSRFIWVRVNLRNDAAMARSFNFDRCELDLADKTFVPSLVATAPMVFAADHAETVKAGASIDRFLIFTYPILGSPKHLTCVPMVLELPPIKPR